MEARSTIDEIGRKLEVYATYEVFNEKREVISKAVHWLKEVQHPAGYWGTRAPIETAFASLALVNVGVPINEAWPIHEANAVGGLNKAKDWLVKNRSSWFYNIWDTSLVLRALDALGQPRDSEIINQSLAWLRSQEKSEWTRTKGTGVSPSRSSSDYICAV
jgi:squalene cyclase